MRRNLCSAGADNRPSSSSRRTVIGGTSVVDVEAGRGSGVTSSSVATENGRTFAVAGRESELFLDRDLSIFRGVGLQPRASLTGARHHGNRAGAVFFRARSFLSRQRERTQSRRSAGCERGRHGLA